MNIEISNIEQKAKNIKPQNSSTNGASDFSAELNELKKVDTEKKPEINDTAENSNEFGIKKVENLEYAPNDTQMLIKNKTSQKCDETNALLKKDNKSVLEELKPEKELNQDEVIKPVVDKNELKPIFKEEKPILEELKPEMELNQDEVIKPVVDKNELKPIFKEEKPILEELKPEKELNQKEVIKPVVDKKLQDDLDKFTDNKVPEEDNIARKALEGLGNAIKELNQLDEKMTKSLKQQSKNVDNDNKGEEMVNSDFSIQESNDKLPQMNSNMNFAGNGQPFSSFMNNDQKESDKQKLSNNVNDLAEEAAILSTMSENIAIATNNIKNSVPVTQEKQKTIKIAQPKEISLNVSDVKEDVVDENQKTVVDNTGIKKIDTKSGMVEEVVVKYDTVVMTKEDVEVFNNLVQGNDVRVEENDVDAIKKSMKISQSLADMLANAKEKNVPIRINFDNNISVIIRISREGKITADFLPSSQIAEAYLKENLPILRQKFDEQNIDYDQLNQRERREGQKEQQRKKGRNNE